jgi:hypothetical protein
MLNLAPIAGLQLLQLLDLEYNCYVEDISAVSKLTALKRLDLMCTKVSDLSPLRGLTALQRLDLRYTPVIDLAPLSDLTALEVLWIGNTEVSDIRPLSGLIALQSLGLQHTLVSDVRPLTGLTNLQHLDLQSTLVSSLVPLANLTELIEACVIPDEDEPDEPYSSYEPDEEGFGLHYLGTPVADYYPFYVFVQLNRPQRTIHTINHIRAEKGLPLHYPEGYEPPIIRSKDRLLVLTEGDNDVSILETAWQKLYPDEERYFELRGALGAKNIQITLNNNIENTKQKIVGILDFDEAYNHWKGIWAKDPDPQKRAEDIVQDASKCLIRKHPSGRAWAMLLPVPTHRVDFASTKLGGRSILSIEFLFEDTDIPQRFVHIEPLPRGASVPVFHRKEEFAEYVNSLKRASAHSCPFSSDGARSRTVFCKQRLAAIPQARPANLTASYAMACIPCEPARATWASR